MNVKSVISITIGKVITKLSASVGMAFLTKIQHVSPAYKYLNSVWAVELKHNVCNVGKAIRLMKAQEDALKKVIKLRL